MQGSCIVIVEKHSYHFTSYHKPQMKCILQRNYMSTSCLLVSTGSVFACGNHKLTSSDAYIKYRACMYCNNQATYAVDRFFRIYIITDILIDIKLKFWRQLTTSLGYFLKPELSIRIPSFTKSSCLILLLPNWESKRRAKYL